MYTLHFYAGTHKEWLREKGDYAMSKGLALFVTECGGMNADGQGPIDVESTEAWIEWMDDNDISYIFWSVSDKAETCSMLYPSASSEGLWGDAVVSPWGKTVKKYTKYHRTQEERYDAKRSQRRSTVLILLNLIFLVVIYKRGDK